MFTLFLVAKLWGVGLAALGLSLLVNQKTSKELLKSIENDTALLGIGIATFMLGVASLLGYGAWDTNWGLVVTVIGWLAVVKGAFLLLLPSTVKKMYRGMNNQTLMALTYFAAVVLGTYLIYMGFLF